MGCAKRTSSPIQIARPRKWLWRSSRCMTARGSNALSSAHTNPYRGLAKTALTSFGIKPKASMSLAKNVRPMSLPNRSRSTSFRISMSSWMMDRPKKNGRWSPRLRKFLIPRSKSPQPVSACLCLSGIARRSISNLRISSMKMRRAIFCARRLASW